MSVANSDSTAKPNQRGLAMAVEAALILPVVMLLLIGLIQLAGHWHARNAAIAAAQLTAEHNRGDQSVVDTRAGEQLAARAGLTQTVITVERGSATVRVTVTGTAPSVIVLPGIGRVEESAVMPLERVVG